MNPPPTPSLNDQLITAAKAGDTASVALLLDRGADIHTVLDGALRAAALNGHTATAAILLDRGAATHAFDDWALRHAALNGHTATVALLLERGADVHAANDSALRYAAANGHTATVALLLDRGADPSTNDHVALREALGHRDPHLVTLLWCHTPDPVAAFEMLCDPPRCKAGLSRTTLRKSADALLAPLWPSDLLERVAAAEPPWPAARARWEAERRAAAYRSDPPTAVPTPSTRRSTRSRLKG